jgi:hypothetical protein
VRNVTDCISGRLPIFKHNTTLRPGRYRNEEEEDCLNLQPKDGHTVTFPLPPHDT